MSYNRQVVSIYAYVSSETLCDPQQLLNLQFLTNKTETGIQLPQFKSNPTIKWSLYLSYYNLLRFMWSVVMAYFLTHLPTETRLSTCQERYIEYAKNPLPGKMIPRCEENGSFEPIQCQNLNCFCVDEDGNPIQGTSLPSRLGKPKCGISG